MLKKAAIVLTAVSILWLVAIIVARTTLANDVHHPINTRWRLVSYTLNNVKTELPDDTQKALYYGDITLEFTDIDSVRGSAGCNSYFGNYEVDNSKIEFDDIGWTLVYCTDEIMQRENEYLDALRTTARFEIHNNTLRIRYTDGQLNFELIGLVESH